VNDPNRNSHRVAFGFKQNQSRHRLRNRQRQNPQSR
jgi:hypothetical protein